MPSIRKILFDNEAVTCLKAPTNYLYIKIVQCTLTSVSAWPYKEIGEYENVYLTTSIRVIIFFWFVIYFAGSFSYIISHSGSIPFLELGHIIVTFLLTVVGLSRFLTLSLSTTYRHVAGDFLTKFHLFFYKDRSEFSMKTHKHIHWLSHIFTLYLAVQSLAGLILFNLIPMYNNYSSGKYKADGLQNSTFEHSLSLSYPFNTYTNINGYVISCIINWFLSYLCATWCCMFDLFLSLMVFNLWGHFKILINNIKEFPTPADKFITLEDGSITGNEMFSKDELLVVSDKLKACIDYHREIIHFTDRMSNVFGPMLFVYYMYHQAGGCILLLECSQMTVAALLRYLPLTVILFQQLIQLSIIFELVGSESAKLADAVYGLPWECMDTKNRKVVAFFLMNVQKPVHVKALGIADVGVTSMATILKTSLSYFTFLRSV